MGVVIRQSIRGALLNYIGVALGAINIMWIFPYYLSPEEIGIYRVVVDLGALFALFAGLGSGHIADRFYVKIDESQRAGFVVFVGLIGLVGFTGFTVLYIPFNQLFFNLFARNAEVVGDYKIYVLILTFTYVLLNLFDSIYRVRLNIVATVFTKEVFLRVIVFFAAIAFGYHYISFYGMMEWVMWSYWIAVSFLGWYYYNQFFHKNPFQWYWPDKTMFKELLSYAVMILIAGGSAILIARIDVLMIAMMLNKGLDKVAIYSLGFFIASVIEVPRRAIGQIAIPLIANAWHNNDLKFIDDIYKRSAINQLIIGGVIFMLIWINIDDLLMLIPQHHLYMECKSIVLWIGIARMLNMMLGLNGEIILQSKYYMFNILSLVFLVGLIILFNYLLIPVLGIDGAAIGSLLAMFFYNVLKTGFLQWKWKMQPFSKHMLYVIVVGFVVYLPFFFLPHISLSWEYSVFIIAAKSGLYLLLVSLILYKLGVSVEMNKLIDKGLEIVQSLLGMKRN